MRTKRELAAIGTRHWHLAIALAAIGGCGLESQDSEPVSDIAGSAQQIRGGSEVTRQSVVALATDVGECTGVMINWYTILTAAHCVSVASGTTGTTQLSAVYQSPSTGFTQCLGRGSVLPQQPNSNPRCDTLSEFDAHVYPGHSGTDSNTDLAVLTAKTAFIDTSNDDYAFIDIDTMGGIDRLEFFGYGLNAYAGTGAGVERSGSAALDSYETHHFNLTASGARACHGDSGGPATIYYDKTAPNLDVLGVFSTLDITSSNTCDADGGDMRYSRLSPKMGFIEQAIGMTCTETKVGGRRVKQCF
jgi:Trypsin